MFLVLVESRKAKIPIVFSVDTNVPLDRDKLLAIRSEWCHFIIGYFFSVDYIFHQVFYLCSCFSSIQLTN